MKQLTSLLLTLAVILLVATGSANAQYAKLTKSVIGNGGMVGLENSNGVKLSGITGQFAIGTFTNAVPGSNSQILNQGFWVPEPKDITSVEEQPVTFNKDFYNYPNPVNSNTTFEFNLKEGAYITLKVYDMVGNVVKTVYDGYQYAGINKISWDAKNEAGMALTSGSYLYELHIHSSNMAGVSANDNMVMRNVLVIVR
ncbi:MAG TPA: FlgD immunoglobulin-like domain containing protein [Candidatus Kapabacteria bacterium]|nr:FlgD immunoglobulin-like domain containing protein [Candidatus Kapabacteria bacterium]